MKILFSPHELEAQLGESLKDLRLQKNIAREALCERAGISVSALRHLETGQGATVKTLIRTVRALGRQDWLSGIAPKVSVNPLHMLRNRSSRQRAGGSRGADGKKAKG